MDTFLTYFITFMLIIGFTGCQNDSSKDASSQSSNAPSQQQPQQLGQMSQQSAPDIDVSDKEADKFIAASMNLQKVQMQAQKDMMGIIKDQGLDIKTYQKIARAKQNGKSGTQADVSDEQMQKYDKASKDLKQKQAEMQKERTAAIEDAGMQKERYRKIGMAARSDKALQKRLRKKMKQKRGAQGMQAPGGPSGK